MGVPAEILVADVTALVSRGWAQYRPYKQGRDPGRCQHCHHRIGNECAMVEGEIGHMATCRLWENKSEWRRKRDRRLAALKRAR